MPILDEHGELLGVVGADFDAENIYQLMKSEKQKMILLTVVVMLVGFISIFILARILIKPLKELIKKTHLVRTGDFTVELKANRNDEIGELTVAFHDMIQDVKQMIYSVNKSSNK